MTPGFFRPTDCRRQPLRSNPSVWLVTKSNRTSCRTRFKGPTACPGQTDPPAPIGLHSASKPRHGCQKQHEISI